MSAIPQPSSINPYDGYYAETYVNGLDPIVAALAYDVNNDGLIFVGELNSLLYDYLVPAYFPGGTTPEQDGQLDGIVGNVFNAYVGPGDAYLSHYTTEQNIMIAGLLGGIEATAVAGGAGLYSQMLNHLRFQDDAISAAELPDAEKSPLFMAVAIVKAALQYFYLQCTDPSADWAVFLQPYPAINLSSLPKWLVGVVRGVLIGITQSRMLVPPDPQAGVGVAPAVITSVGGAIAATMGILVFSWYQRPLGVAQRGVETRLDTMETPPTYNHVA